MKGLRRSYVVESRHGELYTGGPVAIHPSLGLLLPQTDQLNTISLNASDISVSPISGVRERIQYHFKAIAASEHHPARRHSVAFVASHLNC